jgi:glycosyltransferase involved in cell wall biosynthesis
MQAFSVRRAAPASGHIWEQAVLPVRWRGPLLNLCNTAPVTRSTQVVCIHDANVFRMPESYGWSFRLLYRTLQPLLGRRASRVATVSRDSARQLAEHLPVRAKDLVVLPDGHEHAFRWNSSASTLFDHTPQTRPFVLLLGSRARHKNAALVLGLAERLEGLGLDLLVAGGTADIFAGEGLSGGPNVRFLGKVSDDDLALLFSRALCLAFPSITEGFGLPIVEAMALGCPVVSSDRASMPEVCGSAALMAAPDDPRAWLAHIAALSGSCALRDDLRGRGREQAASFSWSDTARGYVDLFRSLQ